MHRSRASTGAGRILGSVAACALTVSLGACTEQASPQPSDVTGSTPPPLEVVATRQQLASGPLQSVLPELASRARARNAVLVVPPGRYEVTDSILLPIGAHLRLATGTVLVGDLPGKPLVRLTAGSSLEGGTLENDATSPGFDLDLAQNAQRISIHGVTFRGASTNALYLAASGIRHVLIDGNRFEQVGYGILLNPPAQDASAITIRRNSFANACADAIEINAPTNGTEQRVRNVTVTSNRMSGTCGTGPDAGFGIGLAGVDGFLIDENTIVGARNEAVHLEDGTTHGTVATNRITGGGHGDRPAIALYRTTSRILVTGNSVADFDGGGIAVRWDGLGSARSVSIEHNRVTHITGDGIVVSGGQGTGPFFVRDNTLTSISGNGISAVGPHELTEITGNSMQNVAGDTIVEVQRGSGQTITSDNSVRSDLTR